MNDYNAVKQTLSQIITVANSKYKSNCLNTSKLNLIQKIEENNILNFYDEFVKSLDNSENTVFHFFSENKFKIEPNSTFKLIQSFETYDFTSKSSDTNNLNVNGYHSVEINSTLKQLFYNFTL